MAFIIPKIMTTATWFKGIDGGCGWQVQRFREDNGKVTDVVVLASGVVDTLKEAQELCAAAIYWDWNVTPATTHFHDAPTAFNKDGSPADAPRPYREDNEIFRQRNAYWRDKKGDLRSTDIEEDSVLALMATGRGI